MKTTYNFKDIEALKKWYIIDAKDMVVGRLATEVARILQGKNKPEYLPHRDVGDYVVIINAAHIRFTGNKWFDKKYYRHSGYMGGLKEEIAYDAYRKDPAVIVHNAVKGMLPKNKLRRVYLEKLRVFPFDKHTHEAQKPETITL